MSRHHEAVPKGRLNLRRTDAGWEMLTIQHAAVANELEQGRIVRPELRNSEFVLEPQFQEAYRWMARELNNRAAVAPSFDPNAGAMFWLWASTTRRDLAYLAKLAASSESKQVLLRVRVPAHRVLCSDFDRWHGVLNQTVVLDKFEERACEKAWELDEEFFTDLEQDLMDRYDRAWQLSDLTEDDQDAVRATWRNCLVARPSSGAQIQACVSHFEPDDLLAVYALN